MREKSTESHWRFNMMRTKGLLCGRLVAEAQFVRKGDGGG